MRFLGHVTSVEKQEMFTKCWFENLKESDHFGYICIDGRLILKWILQN